MRWQNFTAPIFHLYGINRFPANLAFVHFVSPELLALCLECAWAVGEDVLSSEHLLDIIGALQTIGAAQYAKLISEVIQNEFPNVQFPLSEEQMALMQARLDRAEREIGNAPGANDEFRQAMAHYMMTKLNTPENIY